MSREQLAKKIYWTKIIWIVSIINPLMTLPQFLQVWQTHETAGLSLAFLFILLFVQTGFSTHGFFTRDKFIMGSNGLAALMTLLTILSTLYFRSTIS
ncbi:SemiSWEET family transporter [Patescibacteria group bacterium]|nr:SemiSWEET family transporter [Patescibacteria group bacterium]